jgi:hypothetical protein
MEENSHHNQRVQSGIPGINRMPSFGSGSSSLVTGNVGKVPLNSATSSQVGLSRLQTPSVTRAPLGSLFEPTFTSMKVDSPVQVPVIQCEGFLSKFSSGSITGRWQRRYFVLENGRLGYHRKQPDSRESVKPDKSFSLSKLKAVFTKEPTPPNEREFSIQLGDVVYQLKASTPSEMRKWVSVLSIALAHKDSFQTSADIGDGAESSAADMISVSNSISSVTSDGTMISEEIQAYIQQQRVQAAAAAKQHETVWEIDVDPDQLDSLFDEWCGAFGSPDTEKSMSMKQLSDRLVSGLSKSLSHMLCTISGELYDPGVVDIPGHFFRAKSAVTAVKRSAFEKENAAQNRKGEDPIRLQLNAVFMEYVPRQVNAVSRFLEVRNLKKFPPFEESFATSEQTITEDDWSGRTDLVPVINAVSLIMSSISSLFFVGASSKTSSSDCVCCYCDPTGERLVSTLVPPESCQASERWRKLMRVSLQRVCSEFEVGLIEDVQADMYDIESTWEAVPDEGRGPKRASHPLFGNRTGIWMSSWTPHFIFLCEQKAIGVLKANTEADRIGKGDVEYCKRLISEVLASVLVAVLNSAWRQFKRESLRIGCFADERKDILSRVALLHSQNTGFWSVFTSQQTLEQIRTISQIPEEHVNTLNLNSLLSFTNECVLLSTFLSESIEDSLPSIPKIFASCFEGLAATFSNTALEMCRHIVHFHFSEKVAADVDKAFQLIRAAPANIDLVRSTPMITCRDAVEKFVNELIPLGAHPAVKGYCVPHLATAVGNLYPQALLKSRIKLKSNKIILPVVSGDTIILKSLFSEQRLHCKDSVMARAIQPINVVYGALSERDPKLVISEWGTRIAEVFGSRYGLAVAQLVIEMRGDFSKSDKLGFSQQVDPSGSSSTTASTAVSSMVSTSPFIPSKDRPAPIVIDSEQAFPWRLY